MKYLSAQPDSDYFIWQLQVQMNNFRKLKIEKDAVILLGYDINKGKNPYAEKFASQTKASVHFYPDNRTDDEKYYVPTIQPYLIKHYIKECSNSFPDDIFFHDGDILFSSLPKYKPLLKLNKIIVSDTIGYIGAKYICTKSEELLNEMCNIVTIDPNLVKANEEKSGGAQYIFPKTCRMTYNFWNKIQRDSLNLYKHMGATANKYNPQHPIQAWTAGMWGILWNCWLFGYDSIVHKELEFSWPMYGIEDWEKYHIFHNAGVLSDQKDVFFKGQYVGKFPFGENFDYVNPRYCSRKYVDEIIETSKLLNSK